MTSKSQDPKEFLRLAYAQPKEKTAKIAFRGTEDYRNGLDIFAATHKENVQTFIEKAIEERVLRINQKNGSGSGTPPFDNLAKHEIKFGDIELQESELPWVRGLLTVLRGKNNDAKNAIMTNIVAFTGYSASVPELASESSVDLDAMQARLAAIDKQILDEEKTPNVGRPAAAPKNRRGPSGKTGTK